MSDQLGLAHVRSVLIRLEETIIFGLIERAQFKRNNIVYQENAFGGVLNGYSLLGFILLETEKTHAKLRRYTSPDEHPFSSDLPDPILPGLAFDSPLVPNDINVNGRLRTIYETEIVPFICQPGDDQQYGSSAVNDVNCLQALSKRVHYGKFVAESKYREAPHKLAPAMAAGDADELADAITDAAVEEAVLARVCRKCDTYCRDIAHPGSEADLADAVASIYGRWVIPLNKEVQVQYLLQRGTE